MTAITRARAAPLTRSEALVLEVAARLREAGCRTCHPVFPFGAHHRHFRTRLSGKGRHWRVGEVALALRDWARTRDDPDDYVWQAVAGALEAMAPPESWKGRLPADIETRMEDLRWGRLFLVWASGTERCD